MKNFSLYKIENQRTFCMPGHRDVCIVIICMNLRVPYCALKLAKNESCRPVSVRTFCYIELLVGAICNYFCRLPKEAVEFPSLEIS